MGCLSSNDIGLLIFNCEKGNDLQKNYCLKIKNNIRNEKKISLSIKFNYGTNFCIKFKINGKAYDIQNTFDNSESATISAIGKIESLIGK